MPVMINLRRLEKSAEHKRGQVPAAELDMDNLDEVIHVKEPFDYEIESQKIEQKVLVTGRLRLPLICECVRCLKEFVYPLEIDKWVCHLPLEGEERVEVANDCV